MREVADDPRRLNRQSPRHGARHLPRAGPPTPSRRAPARPHPVARLALAAHEDQARPHDSRGQEAGPQARRRRHVIR